MIRTLESHTARSESASTRKPHNLTSKSQSRRPGWYCPDGRKTQVLDAIKAARGKNELPTLESGAMCHIKNEN